MDNGVSAPIPERDNGGSGKGEEIDSNGDITEEQGENEKLLAQNLSIINEYLNQNCEDYIDSSVSYLFNGSSVSYTYTKTQKIAINTSVNTLLTIWSGYLMKSIIINNTSAYAKHSKIETILRNDIFASTVGGVESAVVAETGIINYIKEGTTTEYTVVANFTGEKIFRDEQMYYTVGIYNNKVDYSTLYAPWNK